MKKRAKRVETVEQVVARRKAARARRWARTGVSQSTIKWMDREGWL
jgi:hypothetical protein